MSSFVLAGTGHRPNKRGGYGNDVFAKLVRLATKYLAEMRPSWVISGMALGWDMALAQAAVDCGVPFTAAIPFNGQEMAWPEESQKKYRHLLSLAVEVHVVCPGGYAAWKMQKRNEWMVDNCDAVLALWDGTEGGTGNCIEYATRAHKPIINLWSTWAGGVPNG